MTRFSKKINKKMIAIGLVVLAAGLVAYAAFFHTVTINPLAERDAMQLLEETKMRHTLSNFETDGCSGQVSQLWAVSVEKASAMFPSVEGKYENAKNIPFEYACVEHDRAYHVGDGGYAARLAADNALRTAIIDYAIDTSEDIRARTGLQNTESTLLLYEMIAESIYRGVRLGGAPCTGQPYAWGYGYANGSCN